MVEADRRQVAVSYAVAVASPALRRVLIAEDDRAVRQSLERTLRLESLDVTAVLNGRQAVDACSAARPDLLILDVMMPEMDGLTACRAVRAESAELPILMLTARHEIGDRVAGLEAGADDYLVKPYASAELIARVKALLRRGSLSGANDDLTYADLRLDPAARMVWRGDRPVTLTKTEFDLLELLMWNAGIVLSRDVLYERIWGLRLRDLVALARRVHRVPARQARSAVGRFDAGSVIEDFDRARPDSNDDGPARFALDGVLDEVAGVARGIIRGLTLTSVLGGRWCGRRVGCLVRCGDVLW
jgi:two-component system, OmpR family, response regulator MprA